MTLNKEHMKNIKEIEIDQSLQRGYGIVHDDWEFYIEKSAVRIFTAFKEGQNFNKISGKILEFEVDSVVCHSSQPESFKIYENQIIIPVEFLNIKNRKGISNSITILDSKSSDKFVDFFEYLELLDSET